ncbi:HPP family protein [Chloroflexota bacterium]
MRKLTVEMNLLKDIKRSWARIGSEFSSFWKNYLYQSFLAAIVLAIVMLVLTIEHAVVISSIGATAFIVFLMPRNVTATSRRVIGGHIIGLVSGSLAAFIPHHVTFSYVIVYAIAVGVSAFLMVALDFEHPPASGTALGIAITGSSLAVWVAVLTSSIILSLTHRFFKKHLRDLT